MLLFVSLVFISLRHSLGTPGLGSILDLEEVSSLKYSMRIDKDPVLATKHQSESSQTMFNMAGQKYTCMVPNTSEILVNTVNPVAESETDVEELLRPLEAGPCMYLTKDWWTYEMCYKRHIKQYHMENEMIAGEIILLGVHSPEVLPHIDHNKTYHPQWYINGSRCDLTGSGRKTEVRFVCKEGASRAYLGDILEPQSCEYRLMVHTDKLCGVARMRTPEGTNPLPIVCNPALDQGQMDEYNLYREKVKMARQEKILKRKQDQSLLLKDLEPRERIRRAASGLGTTDGMMEVMGDKITDKMLEEVSNLLSVSLNIPMASIQALHQERDKSGSLFSVDRKAGEVSDKDDDLTLNSVEELVAKRNFLEEKVNNAKSTLAKYLKEMVEVENKLFNTQKNQGNSLLLKELEMEWRGLEMTISSIHMNIAKLESKAKSLSMTIMMMQNKLREEIPNVADENLNKGDDQEVQNAGQKPNEVGEGSTLPEILKEQIETTASLIDGKLVDQGQGLTEDIGDNVKISVSKLYTENDLEEDFDQIHADKTVSKLESLIRKQLSGGEVGEKTKGVEIKLIAVRLPDGEEADWKINTMIYNMMKGDVKGYEDMEQAKKDEINYGFSWRKDMLEKLEQDLLKQSENYVDIASSTSLNTEYSDTKKQGHENKDNSVTEDSEILDTNVERVIDNEDLVDWEPTDMAEEKHKATEVDLSQDVDFVADALSQIFGVKNVKISSEDQEISKIPSKQLSDGMAYSHDDDIYDNLEVFLYTDDEDADVQTVFYVDGENDDIETALYLLGDDLEFESESEGQYESNEKTRKDEL